MAKFAVGALVQLKSGGIRGMVESQIEPDSDHPKAWIRWDDGNYPWGYYQFHHHFIAHDADRAGVTMRLINILTEANHTKNTRNNIFDAVFTDAGDLQTN